ncbi:hypothetical protein CARUB_v10002163mg, partial [Capsella rubella]
CLFTHSFLIHCSFYLKCVSLFYNYSPNTSTTISLKPYLFCFSFVCFQQTTKKLKMLQLIGKYRSRSSCQYQKLSHHYEKVATRSKRHHWGKKLDQGRSKGFRLNRPRRLVLKALVVPRRILRIYSRITNKMNREGLYPNYILSSHWGFPIVSEKRLKF